MNTTSQSQSNRRGLTLLEMTIVILVLLTLINVGFYSMRKMDEWKLGRQASETLREVYSAQRMYLSDNPTKQVSAITNADVIPYLPGNRSAVPSVKSMDGNQLPILVNMSPPIINAGSGVSYDPSGDTSDSLWDVGE